MLQMFHLFHMYVAEVLHVAALAAQEAGACEGGPRGHAGSEAGVGGPHVQQHTGQLGQEQQPAGRAQQAGASPQAGGKRSRRGWSPPAYVHPHAGQLGLAQQAGE
jgi:hypothetical protein